VGIGRGAIEGNVLKKKSLGFLFPYLRETENVRIFLLAEKILNLASSSMFPVGVVEAGTG